MTKSLLTIILVALAWGSDPADVWADEGRTIRVQVGGRETRAWGWSLDGGATPDKPGDLLWVSYHGLLVRGTEAGPKYRTGQPGELFRAGEGGGFGPRLTIVLDPPRREGGAGRAPASRGGGLPDLKDEEVIALRGVDIRHCSSHLGAFLQRLDAANVAFRVNSDARAALLVLPAQTRYLVLTGTQQEDLTPLGRLTALRILVLQGPAAGTTDLRPLASLRHLRVLELPWGPVAHVEALEGLTELRSLSATYADNLADLTFTRDLLALRRVDLSHTAAADLSPLSGHPALELIDAHLTPLRVLPRTSFPALRTLHLGCTQVPAAEKVAFRKVNPDCTLPPGRRARFLRVVAGADRLRVRTRGICHREPEREITRCDLRTPAEIRAFLDLLIVDDCGGHSGCMCCGSPTFEFYAGGELLTAVSLHHDALFRWPGGDWSGDVPVAAGSLAALHAWLRQHGEPGPSDRIERAGQRREEAQRRDERLAAILGQARLEALRAEVTDSGSAAQEAVFLKLEPDLESRVLLALRLLGVAQDWERRDEITRASRASLGAAPQDLVLRLGRGAVEKTAADEQVRRGFDYWLIVGGAARELKTPRGDDILAAAARRLLANPAPEARRAAIDGLGSMSRPFATQLLRGIVEGRRDPGPDEEVGNTPGETHNNIMAAALGLIRQADLESFPRLRELAQGWAQGWDAEERLRLEEALENAARRLGIRAR